MLHLRHAGKYNKNDFIDCVMSCFALISRSKTLMLNCVYYFIIRLTVTTTRICVCGACISTYVLRGSLLTQDSVMADCLYVTWTQHCFSTLPMMQRHKDPAETFKTMAGVSNAVNVTFNSEHTENTSTGNCGKRWVRMRLSFSDKSQLKTRDEATSLCQNPALPSASDATNATVEPFAEIAEEPSTSTIDTRLSSAELKDVPTEHNRTKQNCVHNTEDKENSAMATTSGSSPETL